jgi:hypothetical protein
MKRFLLALAGLMLLPGADAVRTNAPDAGISLRAAALAEALALACPVAGYGDEAAFQACGHALRTLTLPVAQIVAWGGDQTDKQINRKGLTHLNSQVFQTMYLPLFSFTGNWALTEDSSTHTPIIRLQAYFRNTLPPGNYPYPFWHSSDKWIAYETANEVRFYLDPDGRIFVATRSAAGDEARRGSYTRAVTPAFHGSWEWQDSAGKRQPYVSLFSARYSQANPSLSGLDKTYRSFALRIRDESCLECHTPANKAGSDRLGLLQTPLHAAGEIDNVIAAVKSAEMPEDDIGLRKDIPAADRAALLADAMAFRDELARADQWETNHSR